VGLQRQLEDAPDDGIHALQPRPGAERFEDGTSFFERTA
jgi:hypothetical protein